MFNFTIPADGSSVAADDFADAAKASLAVLEVAEDEKAQAKGAADAAIALVKAGHAGAAHVYAVIGGQASNGALLSVGVYERPAPVAAAPVVAAPAAPATSPYYTGAKPDEILREAANTGESVEDVSKRLGVVPANEAGAATKAGAAAAAKRPAAKAPAKPAAKKGSAPAKPKAGASDPYEATNAEQAK